MRQRHAARLRAGLFLAAAFSPGIHALSAPAQDGPDPAEVRRVAADAGLAPLAGVPVPAADLADYLRPGPRAEQALVVLGKALFWDMQVGSDGQACATCHFHAGADVRTKNQLAPGPLDADPSRGGPFARLAGGGGGPNHTLTRADFPFHRLRDPREKNYDARVVQADADDVVSSAGVFRAQYTGQSGTAADRGRALADDVFHVGAVNTRRVEPRNTPTMINAVFNFENFWDGRAHNVFNGVSVIGPLDEDARIHVLTPGGLAEEIVRIPNASLASQAVGPPLSSEEMSFLGRSLPDVGRKLLGLQPLALQLVHPRDGVLGRLARTRLDREGEVVGAPGLVVGYRALIRAAFQRRLWGARERIDGYSQMEANFSLFFGLAIQAYEATLVSDRSRFDDFMAGDDAALAPDELRGLLAFVRRPNSTEPVFTPEIGVGGCVLCHGGPELTGAATGNRLGDDGAPALLSIFAMPELEAGELVLGTDTAFFDAAYFNIGVRPTSEDRGRGGDANGFPLSYARQALRGLAFGPALPPCGGVDEPACPEDERVAVDGAFKVPSLRNVALTGPYFHNGGAATLAEAIAFYDRGGDFGDRNLADLQRNMARIALTVKDHRRLVAFLETLTDPRVQWEMGPFDHPQLFVPHGHPGDHTGIRCANGLTACDDVFVVPPIGSEGRAAAGLGALQPFLAGDGSERE